MKEIQKKSPFTIGGITIGRLFQYFVVYSIAGFIIETTFAVVVYGNFESRQSFLYGPFCSIYGVGAIIIIPALNRLKKNNVSLFIGGLILGSIVEYVISFLGEMLFNIKWWDYSGRALNINGRICLAYSFFWGILAVILMTYINPKIDKMLDKIPVKWVNSITTILLVFLILDALVTSIGFKVFFTNLVNDYGLEIKNAEKYTIQENDKLYHTQWMKWLSEHIFTNEKMLRTFPNITVQSVDGNTIWIKGVLKDIQPYYFSFHQSKTE